MADLGEEVELYQALMNRETDKVIKCCGKLKDGPLHVITIHNDTVLHVALYSMQVELSNSLLELIPQLPGNWAEKMTHMRNNVGHTILYEAATYDDLVPAVEKMLTMAPELLLTDSKGGEKATFRAASYGQTKMFKFLEDKFKQHLKTEQAKANAGDDSYIKRKDGNHFSTVLQVAVAAEKFELALYIAETHPELIEVTDKNGFTPLVLLAHKPRVFHSWGSKWLTKLVNCFSAEDGAHASEDAVSSWIRVPWWEELKRQRKRYILAVKLTEVLTKKDLSWKAVISTEESEQGLSSIRVSGNEEKKNREIRETPLITATKYGIIEIVREVLKVYPQAIEFVDEDGRNILHIAIKYRQIEILNMVEKLELPMWRLIKRVDNNLNSILHMVGEKKDEKEEAMAADAVRSPAHQLQNDLLLYERIEKAHAAHILKNDNSTGYSAQDLFAINSKVLRNKAQEWLKRTAENCSIVAVLIATVAFAAAYTVPGGSDNSGIPVLLNQPFFVIFTIADVLSLTFTLTSVIVFLSILTSPYRLKDFKQSLPQQLMLGITFLILSVSMMMLAFAATIILTINNRQSWTKIALYTVVFVPVTIFIIVHMPLYISLTKTLQYTLKKFWSFFPQFPQSRCVHDKRRKPKSTSSPSTEICIGIEGQRAT